MEAVLVQQNTVESLGRLCWYSRILQEHSGGSAGTDEYYRCTWEAALVQQSNIGALGRLCWYNRVLQKPLGSCANIAEYN